MKLIDKIFQAGIVGCGGAGFPTHKKLDSLPEYFIINGAECEPLLHTDRYIMKNKARQLIEGADLICAELGISPGKGVIALKGEYVEEIKALKTAIEERESFIRIHEMESFYPAGDEQVIVYEVTGRIVPPGGIPLDVGVVVDNAATVLAVYDAFYDRPLTDKYITVAGAVNSPGIFKVPVGTNVCQCIQWAGGITEEQAVVVLGGPMMGRVVSMEQSLNEVVAKTTSGILVLRKTSKTAVCAETDIKAMLVRAQSACIQCSFCTDMCPRFMLGHPLRPHKIMRKAAYLKFDRELLDDSDIRQAAICSQCGVCEMYACPMGLNPRRINSYIKELLAEEKIRYTNSSAECVPDERREFTKAPTKRIAARAGVLEYYEYHNYPYKEYIPDEVKIPLKMHIGIPALPVVSDGDHVCRGQLIAVCPTEKLGANIHASISGEVHLGEDSITITSLPSVCGDGHE